MLLATYRTPGLFSYVIPEFPSMLVLARQMLDEKNENFNASSTVSWMSELRKRI